MTYRSRENMLEHLTEHNGSGLYYIRAKSESVIHSISKDLYDEYLEREKPEKSLDPLVVYIGQAGNLYKRLRQELNHIGSGTFFRSLGAVMGKNPMLARTISGVKNYRFGQPAKEEIIEFIDNNLEVAVDYVDLSEEQRQIGLYQPIFNTKHNPHPSMVVIRERLRCRNIAAGKLNI